MKYKTITLFLSIMFFLFVSCNKKNNHLLKTYEIEIQNNNSAFMSDIINTIEPIPLETTDLSIIRDITKIEFYRGLLYIFDLSQNNIFIFNNRGDYLNRIDNKGQGPDEYLNISDFQINKYTNHICILDAIKSNLLYYNLQGDFQYTESLPKLKESAYNIFQFINDNHIMFWTSDEKNRLKIYEKNTNSIIIEDFPRKGYPRLAYLHSDSLFLPEMSNLVYSYSDNEIQEQYKIEIGGLSPELRSRSFPKSYDTKSQLSFIEGLIKSENIDYLIKDIHSSQNYIVLSFYRMSHYYTFIIVKDSGIYFNFNNNDNFMLSSFIDKKNVLFFSIPQNVCYSCIQSITQMLEIIFPNYEISNNVVFISQNIEDRFKENLEGKVVMTTSEPIISFRSDFLNESLYFFILDETMEVKHLHFFDKSNISRTNVYLKAVSDIILSHKISYQTNSQKPTK